MTPCLSNTNCPVCSYSVPQAASLCRLIIPPPISRLSCAFFQPRLRVPFRPPRPARSHRFQKSSGARGQGSRVFRHQGDTATPERHILPRRPKPCHPQRWQPGYRAPHPCAPRRRTIPPGTPLYPILQSHPIQRPAKHSKKVIFMLFYYLLDTPPDLLFLL